MVNQVYYLEEHRILGAGVKRLLRLAGRQFVSAQTGMTGTSYTLSPIIQLSEVSRLEAQC